MARLFKLTEEQYKTALKEGLIDNGSNTTETGKTKLTVPVEKTNTKPIERSYADAVNTVKANNLKPKDVNFVIDDKTKNESYIISKKELSENRQKALKRNSTTYTVSDFLNQINK
jgi:hypothetical protein